MRELTYRDALNEAMAEEMTRDPNVLVMGEEVGYYQGAYKVTREVKDAATGAIQQIGHAASDIQSMMIRLQGLLAQIEQDPSRFVYQQPPPVER